VARKTLKTLDVKELDTLDRFAKKYKLARHVLDSCGDKILTSFGFRDLKWTEDSNHIFEWEPGRLGACLYFEFARGWTNCKARMISVGCECVQDGETEGIILFNPLNVTQSKVALKEVKPRRITGKVTSQFLSKQVRYTSETAGAV
jgi:hypothetical protein